MVFLWARRLVAGAAAALVAACGGGGGGGVTSVPSTPGEAVVAGVTNAQVLEGGATTELVFTVSLNKASESGNRIIWSTASTAKAGGGGTGSATSGASCGGAVDYVAVSNATLLIPRGTQTGELRVTVCGDAAFEPTETLSVNWTSVDGGGTVTGTIVNDDAGGLNGTGQATAFGRDSNALTNSSADGRLGFSFASASGGQCIRDNVTGLLWEAKTAGNLGATLAYGGLAGYVNAVNGANLCGFSDWRVPTPEELASLVDNGASSAPTTDVTLFTTQAGPYWTDTVYRDGTNQNAWYVDFGTGTVSLDNQLANKAVRLVSRGGTTAPAPLPASCVDATRFTVHGDGTVSDARTGLMWKQCPEGLSGAACAAGTAATLTWDAATGRPATTNADASTNLGYSDWRLPSRAELSSIAEREQCFNPAINQTVFPNTGLVDYWTSSAFALNATLAWRVNFSDGEVAPAAKTGIASSSKRVRLVRAGQ